MATEPTPERERVSKEEPPAPLTITDSTGKTVTLDEAYFRRVEEARRAHLAAPPLSDEGLARLRAEHPDQAWFWTREWYDGERRVDEDEEAGRLTRYDNDEDFLRSFDDLDVDADV